MAWNNQARIQNALDQIRAADGILCRRTCVVLPINIEGINLRGTFDFPVEQICPAHLAKLSGNQRVLVSVTMADRVGC